MTKQERILRKQIKELERLVEIKDEVIKELKTLIRPSYPYYISSGTDIVYTKDGATASDVTINSGTTPYTNAIGTFNVEDNF